MVFSMHLHLSVTEHDASLSTSGHGERGAVGEAPLFANVLVLGVEVTDAAVRETDL